MSEQSKKARAERRAESARPADAESPDDVRRAVEYLASLEPEPTLRAYAIARKQGEGWAYCVLELPQSIVERYAVSVSQPDVLQVALGKMEEEIEQHVAKGAGW